MWLTKSSNLVGKLLLDPIFVSMTLAVPSTSTHRGAAKHHRLCEGESKKLDLQVLQVCQGLCRLVKMHSYALPPPGGHSIEISATSAANKSSAPPNGPF